MRDSINSRKRKGPIHLSGFCMIHHVNSQMVNVPEPGTCVYSIHRNLTCRYLIDCQIFSSWKIVMWFCCDHQNFQSIVLSGFGFLKGSCRRFGNVVQYSHYRVIKSFWYWTGQHIIRSLFVSLVWSLDSVSPVEQY